MLAKHDENYMPKEVADALKQAGHWNEQQPEGAEDAMIAELGHYALVLALGMALVQGTLPLWGAARGDATLIGVAQPAAGAQFLFVTLAFAALMHGYVTSDFSIQNVAENSHSPKPMLYKISGTWGNHEGSLVLWVWILALFGARVAAVRAQPAAVVPGPGAGGAGADRRRLPGLHAVHLEPVPAARPGAARRPAASIRSCRTPASPSIRRCSTSAMSASRPPTRSRWRR